MRTPRSGRGRTPVTRSSLSAFFIAFAVTVTTSAAAGPVPGEAPFTKAPLVLRHLAADPAPEAGFDTFLADLPGLLAGADTRARRAVFADRIEVWERGNDLLATAERKPAVGRWRDIGVLGAILADEGPVGPVPEVGQTVCKPAGFDLDRGRAARIALVTNSTRLHRTERDTEVTVEQAGVRRAAVAPAGTLVWVRPQPQAPGAELVPSIKYTSDGHRVFTAAGGPEAPKLIDLRTAHVCFGRVEGHWKIVAVVTAKDTARGERP